MNMPDLKLELELAPAGLPNLIKNPDGELGSWGWTTPVANTTLSASSVDPGLPALRFDKLVGAPAGTTDMTSELLAIAASRYVSARLTLAGGTAGHHVRLRMDWYTAAKVFISSSAASAWLPVNPGAVVYLPTVQAPVTGAYGRLVITLASSVAGAAATIPSNFLFRQAMVTHAATAAGLALDRTNLALNPSFTTDAALWTASSASLVNRINAAGFSGNGYGKIHSVTAANPTAYHNVSAGVAGTVRRIAVYARGTVDTIGKPVQLHALWFAAPGVPLSGGGFSSAQLVLTGAWQRLVLEVVIPSGAGAGQPCRIAFQAGGSDAGKLEDGTGVDFDALLVEDGTETLGAYFDGATPDAGGVDYSWTGTANASTSRAVGGAFAYVEPIVWADLIGPTTTLQVERSALDVGTLTGTIKDATLDPAVSAVIRPGRAVRLRYWTGVVWRTIASGETLRASSSYDKRKRDAGGRVVTRISLTAVDNGQKLANQLEPRGVATLAALAYLLEGKGVPWLINGNGNQVAAATIVSANERASMLDQVALTRDTVRGYAYVSQAGTLVVDSAPTPSSTQVVWSDDGTTGVGGFPTALGYTGIDVAFSTDQVINHVTVKWLRYNAATAETTEVVYGPYLDAPSIEEWGAYAATFTIHGTNESEVNAAAFAAAVLAANKTPAVRVRSMTVNVASQTIANAVSSCELTRTMKVRHNGVVRDCRVAGISHTINAKRWTVTFTFDQAGTVAAPTTIPEATTQKDSAGWIEVAPNTGANFGGSENTLAYRRINGIVYWKGTLKDFAADTAWLFVPTGYRPKTPAAGWWQAGVYTSAGIRGVVIRQDGAFFMPGFGGVGTYVVLNNLSYPADA